MLINPQVQSLIQIHVNDDEKLLWVSQPDPKSMAWDVRAEPLVGCFIIFGVSLGLLITLSQPSIRFNLFKDWDTILEWGFYIPFLIFPFILIFLPLSEYYKAFRTVYAVTDKRALIIETGRRSSVQSYTDSEIRDIERTPAMRGYATISFAKRFNKNRDGMDIIKFIGINEVQAGMVIKLLKAVKS